MANIQSAKIRPFDLEERTAKFGTEIIKFARKIPKGVETNSLISQIIRSGTSVGANYCEADEALSKKDFVNKLAIAKKEVRKTRHWLRMIVFATPGLQEEARILWKEAQELNLIFASIIKKKQSI